MTSLELEVFDGYTTLSGRSILPFSLPIFTHSIVSNIAREILLEQTPSEVLTSNQEKSVDLLAELAGPIPRQVEHVLGLFRYNAFEWMALISSDLATDREKFLANLLQKSIQRKKDIHNYQITAPHGELPYGEPLQKIIYLRFLLWCCSRSSFCELEDAKVFTRLDYGGTEWIIPTLALTTVGYAIPQESDPMKPSVLAILRGAYKYQFPRLAGFIQAMMSLDLESECGIKNEEIHMNWEMLMRGVWHHLLALESPGLKVRRISLPTFYVLEEEDLPITKRTMPWNDLCELMVDVSKPPCDPPSVGRHYEGLQNYFTKSGDTFLAGDVIVLAAKAPGGDLICRLDCGNSPQPLLSVIQDKVTKSSANTVWKYEEVDAACKNVSKFTRKQKVKLSLFIWASFRPQKGGDTWNRAGRQNWLFLSRDTLISMYGPFIPTRIRMTFGMR